MKRVLYLVLAAGMGAFAMSGAAAANEVEEACHTVLERDPAPEGVTMETRLAGCSCLAGKADADPSLTDELVEITLLPKDERPAKMRPEIKAMVQECFPYLDG